MNSEAEYDILIVGYSMLGNVAALLLANLGMTVAVVEKRQLSDVLLAKLARIDDEVMMIFEHIGIADEVSDILFPLQGMQVIGKDNRVLLEFNHLFHSKFAPLFGFYQPDLQKILQQKALKNKNISVFAGYEVETFEQKRNKVDVFFASTGNKDFKTVSASYLLVCNGQYSNIADYIDIEIEDFKYHSSVLCVDTYSKTDTSLHTYAQTIYDAEFPVTRINNDSRHQRWEFQIGEEKINDSQTSELVRKLLDELSTDDLQIESAFIYNFESRILSQWYLDRVLIAGDAAHIMPPYLGMGLAAGIKDIYNFGWKLKLIKEKVLSERILDTYQKERAPNVRYLVRLNLWIKRLFKSSKLRWLKGVVPVIPKWLLKRSLSTENQIRTGIIGNRSKGAGRLLLSANIVNHKGAIVSLNSVIGNNFSLIGLNHNPVDALGPEQLEFLASLGTSFYNLSLSKQKFVNDKRFAINIYDIESDLQKYLKKHKAIYVLVRPDRIVYDFCANADKLNKTVNELKSKLPLNNNEKEML